MVWGSARPRPSAVEPKSSRSRNPFVMADADRPVWPASATANSLKASSPVVAVGSAAIDLAPVGVKEWAISTFGEADKAVLQAGILVVLAVVAGVMGIAAVKRRTIAYVGLCGFGAIGAWAAMSRPAAGTIGPIPSLIAVGAGLITFGSSPLHGGGTEWDVRAAKRILAREVPSGLFRTDRASAEEVTAVAFS